MTNVLSDGLSDAQAAAVQAVRGPVCILAGAGSGKTRTITHRIANQVHTGTARADQVLALTFTDRAAGELRQRLEYLGIAGTVRAATFHAAAFAQLRYFWPRYRDTPMPEVLERKVRLLVRLTNDAGAETQDLAAEIEWAKARRLDPDAYREVAATRATPVPSAQMAAIYERYEQLKDSQGLIDFDDMLLQAARLLEIPEVAAEVRDRYRFFTVDEFQDVNPAQWHLLRLWLGESDELCVVGDDAQTIYSFSGATSEYLLRFGDYFPHARMISLTDNYRSTGQVLTLANRLLRGRPNAHLRARTAGGPEPKIAACSDDDTERRIVVARIQALLASGVPADEIAICVRTNSQTQAWEDALQQVGIPTRVHGDRRFFARPEIRQAMDLLRMAAVNGIATGPAPPPPSGTSPAGTVRADRAVERLLRQRLSWHPRREPTGAVARERWQNLYALLELVTRIVDEQPERSLADVVAQLEHRQRMGETPGRDLAAVTLLTLHKAKGCEFTAVFIVALEEGLLPISYATTGDEIAEERRLLYVGITRARTHLTLSWAGQRMGPRGTRTRRRPSRFLDQLEPEQQDHNAELTAQLRAWRLERSRRDDVPAYRIFSDRTLRELASQRPQNVSALLDVHGLGETKVRRYGRELLRVLAEPDGRSPAGGRISG